MTCATSSWSFEGKPFPVLEGQSARHPAPPATGRRTAKPHLPRLYSVSSPRDGERAWLWQCLADHQARGARRLLELHVCDLKKGDKVNVTGPFGATFLMPGRSRTPAF